MLTTISWFSPHASNFPLFDISFGKLSVQMICSAWKLSLGTFRSTRHGFSVSAIFERKKCKCDGKEQKSIDKHRQIHVRCYLIRTDIYIDIEPATEYPSIPNAFIRQSQSKPCQKRRLFPGRNIPENCIHILRTHNYFAQLQIMWPTMEMQKKNETYKK